MVFIICLCIGILSAFLGSLMGLGGGMVLVPALLFLNQTQEAFHWATPQTIVGISLMVMVFTSLSSTRSYLKGKRVDVTTGLLFLPGGIVGGITGAWLNQFFHPDDFLLYFGMVTIVMSLLLFLKRDPSRAIKLNHAKRVHSFHINGQKYEYQVSISIIVSLSIVVGLLSGLFGIGGGAMVVPALVLLFGVPLHVAIATSMFVIIFMGLIGAGTHILLGHLEFAYALFFIPGAWIGGQLGSIINQKLSSNVLSWILRLVLIIIGIRMIIEGLM